MPPRRQRLTRAAFPSVLARGRRLSTTHLSVVFSRDAAGSAVVVSKKTARLSVTRHKIKRRVSEALRTLPLPQGALILFPQASLADMSYHQAREELAALLSKIEQ